MLVLLAFLVVRLQYARGEEWMGFSGGGDVRYKADDENTDIYTAGSGHAPLPFKVHPLMFSGMISRGKTTPILEKQALKKVLMALRVKEHGSSDAEIEKCVANPVRVNCIALR